jgi:hypothetical protein
MRLAQWSNVFVGSSGSWKISCLHRLIFSGGHDKGELPKTVEHVEGCLMRSDDEDRYAQPQWATLSSEHEVLGLFLWLCPLGFWDGLSSRLLRVESLELLIETLSRICCFQYCGIKWAVSVRLFLTLLSLKASEQLRDIFRQVGNGFPSLLTVFDGVIGAWGRLLYESCGVYLRNLREA